ncbi:MAG TPA: Gp19/Gp15/Gp42 family protein [Mycobacterium sp.]
MADEPFADSGDIEAVWRTLTADEQARATKLIEYASRKIRRNVSDVDARIASGALDPLDVEMVVVAMVKRALMNTALEGVESQSQTAGPFAQMVRPSNPSGNLYLTKDELASLSPRRAAIRTIRTTSGYPEMPHHRHQRRP